MTDYTDDFENFWNIYPRRISKSTAFKSYQKLTPEEQNLARIDVEKRTRRKWWSSDPKKIAHASTYLNQRRWEDEWEADLVARSEAPVTSAPREYHRAPEQPKMSGWKALANRIALKWLRTAGGLSFDTDAENKMQMQEFANEINSIAKDGDDYFQEDYESAETDADRRTAVMTYTELVLSRLDKKYNRNVGPGMLSAVKRRA